MSRVLLALSLCSFLATAAGGAPLAVTGSVRTVDDGGVAEARVLLVPMLSNFDWARQILDGRTRPAAVATATTGDDGRFALEAPGPAVFRVIVEAPGHVPMRLFPLAVVESIELPPATLAPDLAVSVQVRDAEGRPAAGVWVLAKSADPAFWGDVAIDGWRVGSRIARSDELGRVVLARARGERLTLQGFSTGAVDGTTAQALETAVLLAPARGSARLIEVRDEQGRPVEGLAVSAGDSAWPMGLTDGDGHLELRGRWSAPLALRLFAADGRSQTHVVEPAVEAEGPVAITFYPPVRIAGKVRDATTRRPLAGALVWPGADPGRAVVADALGELELVSPPGRRYWLQAGATGYLAQAQWIERGGGERGGQPPRETFSLRPSTVARGEVVGAEDAPLPGVELVVSAAVPGSRPQGFHPDRAVSRAISDPRGRFRLPALRPDGSYELRAAKPGYSVRTVPLARPGHATKDLRIVLTRARPGFGRVVDVEDRPIEGVEIEVRPVNAEERPAEPWTARSDDGGRFELLDAAAPRLDVSARHPDHTPLVVRGIEVEPGQGPIDLGTLVLEPGISITGRITDPRDQPIEGVDVWIARDRGRALTLRARRILQGEPRTATGADGRFTVGELEAGESFHLFFDRQGYQTSSLRGVVAPPPEPLTVVLEPASQVRGRVEDADGEPIAGAVVSLRGRAMEPGALELPQRDHGDSYSAHTDERGDFELDEVVPGDLELDAVAPGFQPSPPRRFTLAAGEAADGLVLTLERGAVLEGRVTDAEGEGVAGARLAIDRASATSGSDGDYQLDGLATGASRLRIQHPGYNRLEEELTIEAGNNAADWVLEGGWPVAGQVLDEDGAPVAGAHVQLRLRERRGRRHYRVISGDDGAFTVAAVAAGRYDAQAEKAGYAPAELEDAFEVVDGPVEDVELRLGPGASIVGHVLGLDFEDLAAVQVRAEHDGRGSRPATVDYEGGYAIHDLGPGDWLVKAWLHGGRRQTEARVVIAPGDREVTRDLEFGRGLTLSGVVLLGEAPLPGTDVSLRGYDVAVRRSVVTDYQGAFELHDLEPGRYRIDASNSRELVLHNRDLELYDHREVVIRIESARLSGRVVSASGGEPVAGARVEIQKMLGGDGTEPGSLITLASNESGAFTVARLGAGRYRLAASHEGFAPAERMLDVEAGVDLQGLELALSPTEGLDLRLRLASGATAPSARLSVLDPAGNPVHLDSRYLDEQGLAHFPSAPAGTWDLLVDVPGGVVQRLTAVQVPSETPLDVVLADAARLDVRVPELVRANLVGSLSAIDPAGEPFLGLGPHGTLLASWPMPGGSGRLEGLPPGTWTLRATAPDGRAWETLVTAIAGAELRVDLE